MKISMLSLRLSMSSWANEHRLARKQMDWFRSLPLRKSWAISEVEKVENMRLVRSFSRNFKTTRRMRSFGALFSTLSFRLWTRVGMMRMWEQKSIIVDDW